MTRDIAQVKGSGLNFQYQNWGTKQGEANSSFYKKLIIHFILNHLLEVLPLNTVTMKINFQCEFGKDTFELQHGVFEVTGQFTSVELSGQGLCLQKRDHREILALLPCEGPAGKPDGESFPNLELTLILRFPVSKTKGNNFLFFYWSLNLYFFSCSSNRLRH